MWRKSKNRKTGRAPKEHEREGTLALFFKKSQVLEYVRTFSRT